MFLHTNIINLKYIVPTIFLKMKNNCVSWYILKYLKMQFMLRQQVPGLAGQALLGVASLFSSGDSESELRNLSTQITKFLLAGHYHTRSMFPNWSAHLANPCFAPVLFFLWNPVEPLRGGKHRTNLVQDQG